jgi:hypoxanthine phosphoribosyltransferase
MTAGIERIIAPDELASRVADLGASVARDYAGLQPVFVTVLKGATLFLADLLRSCAIDCEVDFMSISSYGSGTSSSGVVRIEKDLSQSVEGRHVVVVEDIVDTGLTLHYLLRVLRAREPASLEVCTLLDKDVRRIVELPIRYRGFSIPDGFVIGYGLDFAGLYRNTDAIWRVDDVAAMQADPTVWVPTLLGAEG